MSHFKNLSATSAVALLDEGATIVDIRDANSFSNSHIVSAFNLNNDNLPAFLEQANRQNPLIVCCYHGISSQSAAEFLAGQGFDDVYSLEGGFEHWRMQFSDRCES